MQLAPLEQLRLLGENGCHRRRSTWIEVGCWLSAERSSEERERERETQKIFTWCGSGRAHVAVCPLSSHHTHAHEDVSGRTGEQPTHNSSLLSPLCAAVGGEVEFALTLSVLSMVSHLWGRAWWRLLHLQCVSHAALGWSRVERRDDPTAAPPERVLEEAFSLARRDCVRN